MARRNYFYIFSILIAFACQKYDDSALQNKLDDALKKQDEIQKELDKIANSQKKTEIFFSTGDLSPNFNPTTYNGYSVSSLNTKFPFYITVKAPEGTAITINNAQAQANTPFELKLDKLAWDGYISIKIDEKEYKVKHIPDNFPRYFAYSKNPSPGDIYLAFSNMPATILSNKGDLLYYRRGSYSDFKKVYNKNGQVRYVVIKQELVPQVDGGGYYQGVILIMDDHFNLIKEVKPISNSAELNYFNENHEFVFIDDDHYIFSLYTPKIVNNIPEALNPNPFGVQVIAAHLQEIKNNQIVWEWFSTDYPSYYSSSIERNNFQSNSRDFADYVHLNSVTIDPTDNNLILSLRNQWSIVKINRTTGNLMWTLSGTNDDFALTPAQSLKGQHYAKIFINPDGTKTITIYDNRTGEALSRVIEYTINESTKTLVNFEELRGPYLGDYMGSAQRLESGRYFIGWGSGANFAATEISRDGSEIYFNLILPQGVVSYRAQKFE